MWQPEITSTESAELEGKWPINVDHPFVTVILDFATDTFNVLAHMKDKISLCHSKVSSCKYMNAHSFSGMEDNVLEETEPDNEPVTECQTYKQGYVPPPSMALHSRVTPPPCMRNPYIKDASDNGVDPFGDRRAKCTGFFTCILQASPLLILKELERCFRCLLLGAVSLCNPFNVALTDEDMNKGFNKVYSKGLGNSLSQVFRRHAALFEEIFDSSFKNPYSNQFKRDETRLVETDINKRDKNEAKTTKPSTGM
ncbi:hypothetical protein Tco_0575398 [Tanacetum coccineum]